MTNVKIGFTDSTTIYEKKFPSKPIYTKKFTIATGMHMHVHVHMDMPMLLPTHMHMHTHSHMHTPIHA